MDKASKLFQSADIEYITPFLKLWMSFNNWYKKDLKDCKNVKKDRDVINHYKENGSIKTYFKRLLEGSSNENKNKKFQEALHTFVEQAHNHKNTYKDLLYKNKDLLYKNPDEETIQESALINISQTNKEYYYPDTDFDSFFSETLEIIYQVRCNVFHGDFDIEDTTFLNLVESSYKILYPIMEKILQNI